MAELTTIYFVVRPHGCACIYWGNKTVKGAEKKKIDSEDSVDYYCPPPSKEQMRKIRYMWATEECLEWEAKL